MYGPRAKVPPQRRFWRFVEKTEACWLWRGATNGHGYGRFALDGCAKKVSAHRYAYELARGPIPPGRVLDHVCGVRLCVNPDHLEPVTQRENLRRAGSLAARDALGRFSGAAA